MADLLPSPEINRLAKRMNIRQQCVATGQMYLKRFYTKVGIRRTNPYLVVATALYLACKMEESPQHIRMVVTEARSLWPGRYIPGGFDEPVQPGWVAQPRA